MVENIFTIVEIIFILFVFIISKVISKYYNSSKKTSNIKNNELDQQIDDYDKYFQKKRELNYSELEICNDFIKNNPENIYARQKRASLNVEMNKYGNAIQDYKYIMQLEPKDFLYVEICAKLYADSNNFNTAFSMVNSFYRKKKKDAKYYNALGKIYEIEKNYELALQNYDKAIKMKPNEEIYYFNRANIYLIMGNSTKYREDMAVYKKKSENLSYESFYIKYTVCRIIFILIFSFLILYFHPTEEVMYCNQNKICTVERTYFDSYKIKKEIKLNPASQLTCHYGAYSFHKHGNYNGLYLRIDGIAPFNFYVANSKYQSHYIQKEELNKSCSIEKERFQKYINENNYYSVRSKADSGKLIVSFLIIIFISFCLFSTDILEFIMNKKIK